MKLIDKRWDVFNPDWAIRNLLVKELSISPITAQVLINRGISSSAEARIFLHGSLEDLTSPWELSGMVAAVDRVLQALQNQEKILVFGDYDVDGMTATAILVSFLQEQGATVGYYIPERAEGYGLNIGALDWAREQGYGLVITVDCGISADVEIAYGKGFGLDFVVTDHHEPGNSVPALEAIINPKLCNNRDGMNELAGVGVVFKLIQALGQRLGLEPTKAISYLDLVALGTVADMVPLIGENRLLVKYGLPLLRDTDRLGLKALFEVTGLEGKELSSGHIAFVLAPRLNAAGRMDSPLVALELLLTESSQRGRELALRLQDLNGMRQLLEQQTTKDAVEMIQEQGYATKKQVLVLASPLWHPGVLGIVASRIAESFFTPTVLLTIEDDQAKGSGRSIPGFDLYQALGHCEDLLVKAGGHYQAVGLTIKTSNLDEFRERINHYALPVLVQKTLKPPLDLETEILPEQLDFQLLDELKQLEPYGQGNPEPIFALRHALLREYRGVGKDNKHLKFRVASDYGDIDGIGFNLGGLLETEMQLDDPVDLAFRLERNHWNGQTKLQLVLEDLKEYQQLDTWGALVPRLEQSREFPKVLESKTVYQCVHGGEQFQLILELILATLGEEKPICLLFPSQRIMAIYERLLNDNLVGHGVSCQRLKGREQYYGGGNRSSGSTVLLAVEGQLNPTLEETFKTIRLVFPSVDDIKPIDSLATADFLLGFRKLPSSNYEFIRNPVASEDKLSYLAELIKTTSSPLFIYSNRKKQILELFHGLRRLLPEKKRRLLYYHQGLCLEQKDIVAKSVSYGLVDVVIANEFLELQLSEENRAGERVIVDAPYSLEELFLKSRPHGEGIRVHGIWNKEELRRNEMTLNSIFPDEGALEVLIQSLMEIGASQEETGDLLSNLRRKFPRIQFPAVQYGLDIIKELQEKYIKVSNFDYNYKTTSLYQVAEAEKRTFAELLAIDEKEASWLNSFLLTGTMEYK